MALPTMSGHSFRMAVLSPLIAQLNGVMGKWEPSIGEGIDATIEDAYVHSGADSQYAQDQK